MFVVYPHLLGSASVWAGEEEPGDVDDEGEEFDGQGVEGEALGAGVAGEQAAADECDDEDGRAEQALETDHAQNAECAGTLPDCGDGQQSSGKRRGEAEAEQGAGVKDGEVFGLAGDQSEEEGRDHQQADNPQGEEGVAGGEHASGGGSVLRVSYV